MTDPVLVALIGAFTTLSGIFVTHWLTSRKENEPGRQEGPPGCLAKILYVKVIHWQVQDDTRDPLYEVRVPRLGDDETACVRVYDMAQYFTHVLFDQPLKNFMNRFMTSGVVDGLMIHPFMDKLAPADTTGQRPEGVLRQALEGPSRFFSATHFVYNGLQPGNQNVATKVYEDTDKVFLIVDYSALPDHENLFKSPPRGVIHWPDGTQHNTFFQEYRPGIFILSAENAKASQVIRLEVDPDWSRLGKPAS